MADLGIKTESNGNTNGYTSRNVRNLKSANAINFLFFLNHELGKMNESDPSDDKDEYIAEPIMRCVEKLNPREKRIN